MKKQLYLLFFLSISFSSFADLSWKCINSNKDGFFGDWSNIDPCYSPVEDAVYKLSVHEGLELEFNKFKNNQWEKRTFAFPGLDQIKDLSLLVKNCSSSLDEPNGLIIFFWFIKIENFNLVLDVEEITLAARYPYYSSINLQPGRFLVSYNSSEDIVIGCGSPPDSHLLSFDGYEMTRYDHLWENDWSAAPMVWDERRNVVVKYGEGDFGVDYSDYIENCYFDTGDSRLREWDGTSWTLRLDVPEPHPPKCMQRMVYDEARGVVVLAHLLGETWEYDGKKWKDLTEET